MFEALLLAVGLAMDASAVAAARGAQVRSLASRDFLLLPLLFGAFQAGMALLGWLGTNRVLHVIERWDHWLAFALLVAIGGKMLLEAWRGDDDAAPDEALPRSLATDLSLAVATSLDAAAAGVSLPSLAAPPALSLTLIGAVTLALSAAAFAVGCRAGARFGRSATALGGVVLIGIAVRLLWSALAA